MGRWLVLLLAAVVLGDQRPIVITGASGRTGSIIYRLLKEKGIAVRGFVRNSTKARDVLNCTKCDASEVRQWSTTIYASLIVVYRALAGNLCG